jgi:hypothetical protein
MLSDYKLALLLIAGNTQHLLDGYTYLLISNRACYLPRTLNKFFWRLETNMLSSFTH